MKPEIKKIDFQTGSMSLHLKDGRIVTYPLSLLPQIKKLSLNKRKKITITSVTTEDRLNGFYFDDCDEVFGILDDLTIKAG